MQEGTSLTLYRDRRGLIPLEKDDSSHHGVVTCVGSSNYGMGKCISCVHVCSHYVGVRSSTRDLEAQLVICTNDGDLVQQLDHERVSIFESWKKEEEEQTTEAQKQPQKEADTEAKKNTEEEHPPSEESLPFYLTPIVPLVKSIM